jgi:hypothetical protein
MIPDTVLCRVVGLQFGLQTLFKGSEGRDAARTAQSAPAPNSCLAHVGAEPIIRQSE